MRDVRHTSESVIAVVLLWLIGAASVVISVLSAINGGVGIDGPFEVWLAGLLRAVDAGGMTVADLRATIPAQDLAKGSLVSHLANWLSTLTGSGGLNGDIYDFHDYMYLGLVTVVVSTLGALALAAAVQMVTRNRMAGAAAFALVASTPLWTGFIAVDYRDSAVAAGLTAVTAAVIIALSSRADQVTRSAIIVFALLGTLVAVAGRTGSIIMVAFVLAVAAITAVLLARRRTQAVNLALAIGAALGGLALAVLNHPAGREAPIAWIVDALRLSNANPNVMIVRVLGQNVMSNEAPWWYVPAWLAAQLPIAMGFAAVIALIVVLRNLRLPGLPYRPVLATIPLLVQSVLLPIAIVAMRPNIYDGIRHFIFIVPGIAGLIALAVAMGMAGGRLWKRSRRTWFVWGVLAVAALSLFANVRWYPYSYTFINPVAGAPRDVRVWDLDFWGLTSREGIERLRERGSTSFAAIPGGAPALAFGGLPSDNPAFDPAAPGSAMVNFRRWDAQMPPECHVVDEIRRDGQLLAEIGECGGISAGGAE